MKTRSVAFIGAPFGVAKFFEDSKYNHEDESHAMYSEEPTGGKVRHPNAFPLEESISSLMTNRDRHREPPQQRLSPGDTNSMA